MLYKRVLLILSLVVAILLVTACNARIIRGSGDVITETRQVSGFDSISLSGSGEVTITQGGSESLTVETDENVMEHVETEVRNGTLYLGFEDGVNLIDYTRLVFAVGVDDLEGLSVSGSGDIEADKIETGRLDAKVSGSGDIQIADLVADRVTADISGSGEIDLSGEATVQDIKISGSGKYQAGDLLGESVKVNVSGSGRATVWVTESLDSTVSGSGSVSYYGRPSIDSTSSGSGGTNSLGEK